MVFASAGYNVALYDILPEQVASACSDIQRQLAELEAQGMLRGELKASEISALVVGHTDLDKAVKDASYVQVRVSNNVNSP